MPLMQVFWKAQATMTILLLLRDTLGQECAKPSEPDVTNILILNLKANFSAISSVSNITDVHVYSYNYTCLAVRGLDVYASASVAVDYCYSKEWGSESSESLCAMSQFEMECDSSSGWGPDANNTLESPSTLIFTTQFCSDCIGDSLNMANGTEARLHNCYRKWICLQELSMPSSLLSFLRKEGMKPLLSTTSAGHSNAFRWGKSHVI